MTLDEPELTLVSTDAPESPDPVTPEAEIESSPTLTTSEEPIAALPEPVGVEGAEPKSPAAPSVFARRAPEPVAPPAEPKVSFAHMAKELLSVTNPTAREETPVASQQPTVEELTRATLDDLVGSGEKPAVAIEEKSAMVSAFAKPATAKRPRTIAPPPPDPQPIAAGPTLGAAPKRITPPAPPAATPDPSPTAEPEGAQAAPTQSFEGLQFPNDGVLTRQWMEFLNQMAAGK
jgi:hypothetical protein